MHGKLACPYCGHRLSKVTDARANPTWALSLGVDHEPDAQGFWRRRKCLKCGERFTTKETLRDYALNQPADLPLPHRLSRHDEDEARSILHQAVRKGEIVRPKVCAWCEETPVPLRDGRPAIEAHHPDYRRPLDVIWLCARCHRSYHQFLANQRRHRARQSSSSINM